MDFYAAAAQVIPVLLLALIFENRMLVSRPSSYGKESEEPSQWNATQIVGRIYLTLLIVAGEVASLAGLYTQERHSLIDGLVWLGLAAVLLALTTSVLSHQLDYWRQWWGTSARADWWLSAFIVVGLLVLTVTVLTWFV